MKILVPLLLSSLAAVAKPGGPCISLGQSGCKNDGNCCPFQFPGVKVACVALNGGLRRRAVTKTCCIPTDGQIAPLCTDGSQCCSGTCQSGYCTGGTSGGGAGGGKKCKRVGDGPCAQDSDCCETSTGASDVACNVVTARCQSIQVSCPTTAGQSQCVPVSGLSRECCFRGAGDTVIAGAFMHCYAQGAFAANECCMTADDVPPPGAEFTCTENYHCCPGYKCSQDFTKCVQA